ncbi:hypothetical protein Dimus_035964 [Dionaea muscipula]
MLCIRHIRAKPSLLVRHFSHSLEPTPSPPQRRSPRRLSFLADKCSSMHQLKQVQAQMIITGRIHDNYAASRLLLAFTSLSDSGDISYAAKLFHRTHEPNTFMWNTMITAFAGSSDPSVALFLYVEMRRRVEVRPGRHTFPFVLKACSKLQWLRSCRQIHGHVVRFGLELDLFVANGLVRGYSVSGGLGYARCVFDEMSERNLSVWTSMVCGYAQNDCSNEALVLFDRMVGEGFVPNGATLASVLSASAKEGCLELGDRIYEFMREKGIGLGVILGTASVHMYAKSGAVSKARVVFETMQEKNIATWNAMIHGLAFHGHGEEALSLFYELKKEKAIKPNHITFIGVLSACGHAGLLELGHDIFHSMTAVYDIEPKIEHYGCMVNLLGREGKLVEAENLIRSMPWKPDIMIWGSLLTACNNCGNIEVAKRVVGEILALDPSNHGVHVILSNMYAETGSWGHASRQREVMRTGNLKKIPGSSSAENGRCESSRISTL